MCFCLLHFAFLLWFSGVRSVSCLQTLGLQSLLNKNHQESFATYSGNFRKTSNPAEKGRTCEFWDHPPWHEGVALPWLRQNVDCVMVNWVQEEIENKRHITTFTAHAQVRSIITLHVTEQGRRRKKKARSTKNRKLKQKEAYLFETFTHLYILCIAKDTFSKRSPWTF